MILNKSTLINLATMGFAGLAMPNKDNFTTVSSSDFFDCDSDCYKRIEKAITIFLIITFILWIMLLIATYKLTDSGAHTVLCAMFGFWYMAFAFIYYGLSGYKFVKRSWMLL